ETQTRNHSARAAQLGVGGRSGWRPADRYEVPARPRRAIKRAACSARRRRAQRKRRLSDQEQKGGVQNLATEILKYRNTSTGVSPMPSLLATVPTALTRLPALNLEPSRIIIGRFYQYIDNRGGWISHETKAKVPVDHDILGLFTRRARQRFVDGRPEIIA